MAVKSKRLGEIATFLDATCQGDEDVMIHGVATLQQAQAGDISFLSNPRYKRYLKQATASAVLLKAADAADYHGNALIVNDPYLAYAKVASLFAPELQHNVGVHPSAIVAEDCELGENVSIGPYSVIETGVCIGDNVLIGSHCVIGQNSRIASDSHLWPNVSIYHGVQIGRRTIIHSGAVIGSDGFGLAREEDGWLKIPQLGAVVIGDDVEIGANTTIDRGAIEDTVIADGVKLDNQIQIAHNVKIGERTAMAGCVGVSGSTSIGADCAIGGGTGISGHINITDGVTITGMSAVPHSIDEPGYYSSGLPIQESRVWFKNITRFKRLDEYIRRLLKVKQADNTQTKSIPTNKVSAKPATSSSLVKTDAAIDIKGILNYLPHRYPFLLIDRVVEIELGQSLKAIKNVTMNEQFFTGHFPDEPVMPGVIIVEALAQASCVLAVKTAEDTIVDKDCIYLFAAADKLRFKRVVVPGDQLCLEVWHVKNRNEVWKFKGKATVNGELVCEAELTSVVKQRG